MAISNNKLDLINKCVNTPLFCFISGIANVKYQSIDHFSFIPYFILVLSGMFVGQIAYSKNRRNFNLSILDKKYKKNNVLKLLAYIGQKSLTIYIIHWAILYYLIRITS